MTLYSSNLLFKDAVKEADLEFTGSCIGGGDITGLLTTPQDDLVLERRDGGCVDGCICAIRSNQLEGFEVIDAGRRVLGRGDKVGLVLVKLQIRNGLALFRHYLGDTARLGISDANAAILMASQDLSIEIDESSHRRLGTFNDECCSWFNWGSYGVIGLKMDVKEGC